jgi:hypothetical protein
MVTAAPGTGLPDSSRTTPDTRYCCGALGFITTSTPVVSRSGASRLAPSKPDFVNWRTASGIPGTRSSWNRPRPSVDTVGTLIDTVRSRMPG